MILPRGGGGLHRGDVVRVVQEIFPPAEEDRPKVPSDDLFAAQPLPPPDGRHPKVEPERPGLEDLAGGVVAEEDRVDFYVPDEDVTGELDRRPEIDAVPPHHRRGLHGCFMKELWEHHQLSLFL